MTIDLNCDMGEREDVPEDRIMPFVTSVNVACGGHAGDERTMERTLLLARRFGVMCGAHPGYPDRESFGREEISLRGQELAATVHEQVSRLSRVAERLGITLTHVKPHGALYNAAARDPEVAAAISEGVARWKRDAAIVGLAGSGFGSVAEAFADRSYEPDGTLRSRKLPGAVIEDPQAAAEQALSLARSGGVQTICVHGDNPSAPEIAQAVRTALRNAGVEMRPMVTLPEPWMRGPLPGLDPLFAPVLYTFMHAREELARHSADLTEQQLLAKPSGAASVAFHIRHIAGSTDRLMTYLQGRQLTEEQMAALRAEEAKAGGPREELLGVLDDVFVRAEQVVRGLSPDQLRESRELGRKRLPTTVNGLLVHIAEHTMRHVGQAVTTAKVVRGSASPGS